jgi:hypothetical protein
MRAFTPQTKPGEDLMTVEARVTEAEIFVTFSTIARSQ